MIVRNEAAVIEECLSSIAGHVDEIVVVDTGSSDETLSLAERHGARILLCPWDNDFSGPRNAAIEAATGDWILYIDADERISVSGQGRLSDCIDEPDLIAVKLRLQPRCGYTTYHEYRLFRRDPRIRFVGCIHERVAPSIWEVAEADGLRIGTSEVLISHVGYEGDLTRKHHRNLPLLRRAVEQNPGRVFCWTHLGETLAALGKGDEAEKALRTAIRVSNAGLHPHHVVEASLAYQQLVRLLLSEGKDAVTVAEQGLAAFPDDHALRLLLARALVDAGRESEARAILEKLLAIDPETFFDSRIAFDRRIFGEFAYELAGLAAFRLGNYADAANAYGHAFKASGDITYRVKADLARARVERS
jgi:glycosyltransferase involved in cell wall biosynthesis